MDSIKIPKQKHIQFCLLSFASVLLIFSTVFVYILCMGTVDWEFNFAYTVVFVSVLAGSLLVPIFVFFILRLVNKSYYIISSNGIKLFKNGQEVFFIPIKSIGSLKYLSFKYALLFQMGAGYLCISFEEAYGKIKPTMTFPDLSMLLGIDMTEKQAKQVARILGKGLN